MLTHPSNSVIRDCIHELIDVDESIRNILDTKEVQRLRWVRQTGLSYLVFPTAEHSRFSHALGAYATAKKVFAHLRQLASRIDIPLEMYKLNDDLEHEFAIAALCHDIGHTAFSHVLEQSLLPKKDEDGDQAITSHEDCAIELLHREAGEIGSAIKEHFDLDAITQFLTHNHAIPALSDLISSDYDVDRSDYLLRDSYMMGVEYGKYDLTWLIHTMSLRIGEFDRPFLVFDGARGIDALRKFLIARRLMYRQIYFHPTIRAYQILLRSIFERAQDVKGDADKKDQLPEELIPRTLRSLICDATRPSLDDFISTNDATVFTFVQNLSQRCNEPVLRYLAKSFFSRQLTKKVFDSTQLRDGVDPFIDKDQSNELIEKIKKVTIECIRNDIPDPEEACEYLVTLDTSNLPSVNLSDLYLKIDGNARSLEAISDWGGDFDFRDIARPISIRRLFVPAQARQKVLDLLKLYMGGD